MFKRWSWFGLVSLILFTVDRWLKYWFLKNPSEIFGGDFISGFQFALAKNDGIAFGLDFNRTLIMVVTIILIVVLIKLALEAGRAGRVLETGAFTLVIVGAASNLIDRLRHGFVVDYLDVSWFTVFNLADAMITVGVGLLILVVLISNHKLDKKVSI